ncbi:hypothetical protein MSSAC_0393 [Methanosarcina siciliae C2J]|uniref:Uncharacterized protein n=1 Tax=Methanosarcina siciliae C2J TaxID=1434118 RepID=A0A0E3PJ17_9EURY|nr:hypothetical protein [Methanosarcina siciliae]AKB34983.1 hypothetical protein MSSAC_0393 [Methanosarcina siciliae C2J]
MIKYRKFGVLTLSLMILLVFAVLCGTALSEENDSIEDVPDLPLILRGGLNVDGEPVSEGSEILAYYDGELIAKSTVGEEGKYSLNLNLTPENYTNLGDVELYVNENNSSFKIPVSEIEAVNKTAGSISEIDLEVAASSEDSDTSSSSTSSSGSGDSVGEVKIVKNSDYVDSGENGSAEDDSAEYNSTEDDSTEEGDSQETSSVEGVTESSVGMSDPVSQAGEGETESTEESGYSTFFTGLLFITALLGAFYVIKK